MRTIRNIGVLFIVTLMIMATGGVSVYHHFCHCGGEMSASVFFEAACEHEDDAPSCCSAEQTKSCCVEENEGETKHACHDENCCRNTIEFVKISDSFHPGFEKITLKPCLLVSALILTDIQESILSTPALNIYSSDLPPPDSGRQILISLHQLKLDTHLV
jgi:hypothetical protein